MHCADVSAAAGPVGRTAAGPVMPTAAVYTYSRSKGLFAGVSLEGAVIGTQRQSNFHYYGRPVRADSILSGTTKPPPGAAPLRRALGREGVKQTLWNRPCARAFESRCQLDPKRQSQDSALYLVEPPLSVF
jgi:lipid-binding SYLF domain-containing protein